MTESISHQFEEKLKRSRRKGEYLRIQATTLETTHPEVALALTDRYLLLPGESTLHAGAHCTRARAYVALARLEDAVSSYEAALACEADHPGLVTTAALDYPFLVATRRLTRHFAAARAILTRPRDSTQLPVHEFMRHASMALMCESDGTLDNARAEAAAALRFATLTHSGLPHNPSLGLVTEEFASTIKDLRLLADA